MGEIAKILIVEDEPPLAELESIALEGSDFEIQVVGRGDEGLEALATGKIALVLLDYKLPDMNGSTFIQEMGELVRSLPVIVITGYADTRIAIDLLRAGAADYVIKDTELVFLQQLPKTVADTLERYDLKAQNRAAEQRIANQAEDLLVQAKALADAKEQADAANRSKSEFLTNLSHEIRTPMTAILGFVDQLLRDDYMRQAPAARLQDLLAIRSNGSYLLELLDDILDLSEVETGRLQVERRSTDLGELLAEVMSWLSLRAESKGLGLSLSTRGAVPANIDTDPVRLRQILLNLLANAIKFTEVGEVELEVGMAADQKNIELAVRDTGIGIAAEAIPELFQPFSQADASTSRRFSGAGLGLSLCRRLASLLGGEIAVESTLGQGTTFRVTLPVETLDDVEWTEDLRRDAPPAPPLPERFHNKLAGRFLLAEDNPVNQVLTASILEAAGADVIIAENGERACELALAAEQERPFDLVLMDLQMPVVDGYEATRRLRREGFERPILALTAHAMAGHRERSLDAGCNGHVTKPIDRDQLIEAITAAL